jgi:hypothetical protein
MIKPTCGRTAFRLYQKKIWTSTGVPRKNQMYSQLTHDITGLGESRITASTTPSTMPITIASTVSSMVTTIPPRMKGRKSQVQTWFQSRLGAAARV